MPYTTRQAVDALDAYLGIDSSQKQYIPGTKERGCVLTLPGGEKIVVFVYPLVHKQDNTKNFFDTRDSGAHERGVAWSYSLQEGLKYFCVGVNDQVDKFEGYVFSLECSEKKIERISGTRAGVRSGPGNQIIIPNDYIPDRAFERIRNKLGVFISVIRKDHVMDYFEKYDNRPYLEPEGDQADTDMPGEDQYARAAGILSEHLMQEGITYEETEEEIEQLLAEFRTYYAPEKLKALPDGELLKTLFYTADGSRDCLCYFLEFNQRCRNFFGSISGGSAFKFGLFQRKEDGQWMTGSAQNPLALTNQEALAQGRRIRDYLVKGAELIRSFRLEEIKDYERLDDELTRLTDGSCSLAWIHKYYQMCFPELFAIFHSGDWQRHVLYALRIKPSGKYYGRCGQISMVARLMHVNIRYFSEIFYDRFGGIKHFCRIGTSDRDGHYAAELRGSRAVGVGWNRLGPLEDYVVGNTISRKAVGERLREEYYQEESKASLASRKAGEIATFYSSNADTVFVVMDGERLIALVDQTGDYFFDASKPLGHRKQGEWHCCFREGEELPNESAGHMTTCYELQDEPNLMFLYEKYYYDLSEKEDMEVEQSEGYIPPRFKTGLASTFERNRIVFGAPGTGKSHRLKEDSEALLSGTQGTMERVTFHSDYTYSQFVGTYKPVTDARGEIRYDFVPGPFMRVYVDAILSGRTEEPKPHLLLVEEINRAKVAAVFGDVFQLLDRDEDGVSEYEIRVSEDIQRYLAARLGGGQEHYTRIMLPDNMFIWATMNSADQGVYPMDTAFKRRWSFEYLGINDNEEKIRGSVVLGEGADAVRVEWNRLRRAVNDKLAKDYRVNEDKLMGPFFLDRRVLRTVGGEDDSIADRDRFIETFKSKVIMYLYEDAAKQYRQKLFAGCDNSRYSSVCAAFDKIGIKIFGAGFKEEYYD